MLTKDDIVGFSAMIPTPCLPGQDGWDAENSVDLDETARMVEKLVQDGAGNFAVNGTTGECAALLWEEKLEFNKCIIETNNGRIPVFSGVTALGTKETVRQMKAFKDLGADGVFVGLPLWQTPSIEMMVQFYADLAEAVPDMPIMIYSNPMFFKSTFPVEFWQGVGKRCPTVITNKFVGNMGDMPNVYADLEASMDAAPNVAFLPIDFLAPVAYQHVGDRIKSVWSTSCSMGPEPVIAMVKALQAGDAEAMGKILHDMHELPNPILDIREFPKFNVQVEKTRTNAAGYINAGPVRAPYQYMPDDWREHTVASGKAWAEYCKTFPAAPSRG
ncbi:MAG TPA: aldolase [Gammaproteobacteria bacterium]|nr:aldolase [Gammaproteobacteria bacterium]